MQHMIDKIASQPWFDALLIVAFVLCMLAYWARIRRDDRRRKDRKHESQDARAEQARNTDP